MSVQPAPRAVVMTELRDVVHGRVWLPDDPDFQQANQPWNLAVEQVAAAVVEAADAADVAALVRYASSAGLGIAAQPTGHGASGTAAGTIVLRTSRLDRIDIDPGAERARIGAGVRSGDLQRAAGQHGLTALPGSSPVVSVTGVTLGGGLSWFGRAFGWVADTVRAFEVVDADGALRTVTEHSDADLFWALRGGGGDYAIVTGVELSLREAPTLFGGRVLWHGSHARAVAETYRAITADAPNNLTLWLGVLNIPGAEPMIAIDSTFLGAEADARELMADMDRLAAPLSDTRKTMSVAELGGITGEPTDPSPGQSRAELLTELDDAAVSALVDEPIAPLLSVQIRHLGGAFTQPSDSPHGPLGEPYAAYLFGIPANPATAEAIIAKQAALADRLPLSGRKPVTFLNPAERLADALPASSIERLRRIKTDRDPKRIFRSNFSVLD